MAQVKQNPMRIHKLRFQDSEPGDVCLGKFRKSHEVTLVTDTTDSTADQMVTWVNTIMIDKMDIQFLMESDA